MSKYKLNWIPTGWDTPEMLRGVPHVATFDSLEDLKNMMSKCVYNGEWVTDSNNNKVEMNWSEICVSN